MCQKKRIQKLSKSHKTQVTVTFLKEQNIQDLAHPPHSPDVAPCGFSKKSWLGENVRAFTLGPHETINSEFQALCPSDSKYSFESWRRRLELCACEAEDYFDEM